jgi:hypothetical protein
MWLGENLQAAISGPGHLRFIVQPVIALLLGIRDGRRDYRAGEPPYGIALILSKGHRRERLKAGLRSIVVPLCIAILLDAVIQFIIFRSVTPRVAVSTGILLIAVPYIAGRGLTNRALRLRRVRPA